MDGFVDSIPDMIVYTRYDLVQMARSTFFLTGRESPPCDAALYYPQSRYDEFVCVRFQFTSGFHYRGEFNPQHPPLTAPMSLYRSWGNTALHRTAPHSPVLFLSLRGQSWLTSIGERCTRWLQPPACLLPRCTAAGRRATWKLKGDVGDEDTLNAARAHTSGW